VGHEDEDHRQQRILRDRPYVQQTPSTAWARSRRLLSAALRGEIDLVNEFVYEHLNNGVYRTGFARLKPYDEAVKSVRGTRHARAAPRGRALPVGNTLTGRLALFPTLVRFDAAYHHVFKCTWRPLASYDNLYNYMLDLYQVPAYPRR